MKRIVITTLITTLCMLACESKPEFKDPEKEQISTEKTKGDNNSTPQDDQASNEITDDSYGTIEVDSLPLSPWYIYKPHNELFNISIQVMKIGGDSYNENFCKYKPDEFEILFLINTDFDRETKEAEKVFQDEWSKGNIELINKIQSTLKEYGPNGSIHAAHYSAPQYAFAPTNITISCDQVLWGVEAGGNLLEKFYVYNSQPSQMVSYPDGEYLGDIMEQKENSIEMLAKSMIPQTFTLRPIAPFEEKPEQVCLEISLDLGGGLSVDKTGKVQFYYE